MSFSYCALLSLGLYLFPLHHHKLPVRPSSKTSEQKAAVSCHIALRSCQNAALCRCNLHCVWFGANLFFWRRRWLRGDVLFFGLAEGQEPFVRLQWARRLTEPHQSQDAAWDIDRLEPEGSCRIGTHCQRLGYHHRLPASEGGRGASRREG